MEQDENKSKAELLQEIQEIRKKHFTATQYIRQKVNQLLTVMGTAQLRPEELDDNTLIELDPISIVSGSFAQVLRHLKETNEQLKVAHDEITAIFDSAGMGILVVDSDLRILAFNKKITEQFHPDGGLSAGMFCRQLICQKEQHEQCPAVKAIETGASSQTDQVVDGRHFNVVATPIRNKDGPYRGSCWFTWT